MVIFIKASLREQDKLGRNVLHFAAEAGNTTCIQYLVKCHNMCVDSQTYQGLTPLHFACKVRTYPLVPFVYSNKVIVFNLLIIYYSLLKENKIDTFYVLLELGGNCYLTDNKGRTG